MIADTASSTTTQTPLIDKAFFGKDNCLTVQIVKNTCYVKLGKKVGEQWTWKNTKMSDTELGEVLSLLEKEVSSVSFYHSFQGEATKIWINQTENGIVWKVEDYTKGLSRGEARVLKSLLEKAIWMMNLA